MHRKHKRKRRITAMQTFNFHDTQFPVDFTFNQLDSLGKPAKNLSPVTWTADDNGTLVTLGYAHGSSNHETVTLGFIGEGTVNVTATDGVKTDTFSLVIDGGAEV